MKTGVSLYSFHNYAKENSLGAKGCIKKAAEMGIDGLDFIETGLSYDDYIEYAKDIRKYCKEVGIEPVCFCTGADFLNCGDISEETEKVKRNVDIAAAYGCRYMRHDTTSGFGAGIKTARSFDNAIEIMAPAIREITLYAKKLGIVTITENHGFFSQDSDRVEKLINAVNDDNFGMLVDIGNFSCADESSVTAVGRSAPYARHVHAKDFHIKSGMLDNPGDGWFMSRGGNYLRGAIIGHGDIPVKQCIGTLARAGYDGYVTIEFEGLEDPIFGISAGLSNLKKYLP